MKNKKRKKVVTDRHLLYSAAVQSPEADLDFFVRVYKAKNGRTFRDFREDFCGTAALACEWVRRGKQNRSWGIDLDSKTLDWGRKRYVSMLKRKAERIELLQQDVMESTAPKVDVIAALNFSYSVFKTREQLRDYFRSARQGLREGGVFFLDAFGGTEAMCEDREKRKVASSKAFDGTKIPAFTYVWEQKEFNTVDHNIVCQIHFKLANGEKLDRAFHYDWRLWSLPELQELLREAGFKAAEVYLEGWDEEEDDTDGVFRRRTHYENQSGWVAYVVGLT